MVVTRLAVPLPVLLPLVVPVASAALCSNKQSWIQGSRACEWSANLRGVFALLLLLPCCCAAAVILFIQWQRGCNVAAWLHWSSVAAMVQRGCNRAVRLQWNCVVALYFLYTPSIHLLYDSSSWTPTSGVLLL